MKVKKYIGLLNTLEDLARSSEMNPFVKKSMITIIEHMRKELKNE